MRKSIFSLALVLSVPAVFAAAELHSRPTVLVSGTPVPAGQVLSIVLDSDGNNADAAAVMLDATGIPVRLGDALAVDARAGDAAARMFAGEIVAVEPATPDAAGGAMVVVVHASDRLSRLARARRTRTFEGLSDAAVAARLAADAGLAFGPTGPEAAITFDRIVQQNQTDLEFLRDRAGRIDYELTTDETTLYFRRRQEAPVVALGCGPEDGPGARLNVFHPRTASAHMPSKAIARGYDPSADEEIVGVATRRVIALSPDAIRVTQAPGPTIEMGSVPSLQTAAAAHGAAAGTLSGMIERDWSAEGDAEGSAAPRAGGLVTFQGVGAAFSGEYRIASVSHRIDSGSRTGWHTLLRLARRDGAVFLLPEVGDEVLVAFESGDLSNPFVVGSLWDAAEAPREASVCGRPPDGR